MHLLFPRREKKHVKAQKYAYKKTLRILNPPLVDTLVQLDRNKAW